MDADLASGLLREMVTVPAEGPVTGGRAGFENPTVCIVRDVVGGLVATWLGTWRIHRSVLS